MKNSLFFKKEFYLGLILMVIDSFKMASKGKENLDILIWRWGLASYFLSYFVLFDVVYYLNKDFKILSLPLAIIISLYFIWHIYAIWKCSPKKPKLTKAEKKQKKLVENKNVGKSFIRKLLLQEPWMKTKKTSFAIIVDLLCLAFFVEFII